MLWLNDDLIFKEKRQRLKNIIVACAGAIVYHFCANTWFWSDQWNRGKQDTYGVSRGNIIAHEMHKPKHETRFHT